MVRGALSDTGQRAPTASRCAAHAAGARVSITEADRARLANKRTRDRMPHSFGVLFQRAQTRLGGEFVGGPQGIGILKRDDLSSAIPIPRLRASAARDAPGIRNAMAHLR